MSYNTPCHASTLGGATRVPGEGSPRRACSRGGGAQHHHQRNQPSTPSIGRKPWHASAGTLHRSCRHQGDSYYSPPAAPCPCCLRRYPRHHEAADRFGKRPPVNNVAGARAGGVRHPLSHDSDQRHHPAGGAGLARCDIDLAIVRTKIIRYTSFSQVIGAAVGGAGLALGRSPSIDPELTSGRFVRLFPNISRRASWHFVLQRGPGRRHRGVSERLETSIAE
jgi:hypothetical protein